MEFSDRGLERRSEIGRRIGLILLFLAISPIVLFIVAFNASLAWIAWWPLPSVPHYPPTYQVTDLGMAPKDIYGIDFAEPNRPFYTVNQQNVTYSLTPSGTVQAVPTSESFELSDDEVSQLRQLALQIDPKINDQCSVTYARHGSVIFNREDYARVRFDRSEKLWIFRKGSEMSLSRKLRGYSWNRQVYGLSKINEAGDAIGNGSVATGFASSGGTSDPHGRCFGVVCPRQSSQATDLNGLIDPDGGWYIFKTLDIDEQGRILCFGEEVGARQAETTFDGFHFVLLTPH